MATILPSSVRCTSARRVSCPISSELVLARCSNAGKSRMPVIMDSRGWSPMCVRAIGQLLEIWVQDPPNRVHQLLRGPSRTDHSNGAEACTRIRELCQNNRVSEPRCSLPSIHPGLPLGAVLTDMLVARHPARKAAPRVATVTPTTVLRLPHPSNVTPLASRLPSSRACRLSSQQRICLRMRATPCRDVSKTEALPLVLAYKRELPLCLMMADSARNRSASAAVFAEEASLSSFADIAAS